MGPAARPLLRNVLGLAVACLLAFVFGLILATPAYPDTPAAPGVNSTQPPSDVPATEPAGAPKTPTELPVPDPLCLNCSASEADLIGGAQMTWSPNGGWNLRPFVQATGEAAMYLGNGRATGKGRAYFRVFSDLTIGSTRPGQPTPEDQTPEVRVPTVDSWSEVELVMGVATVVGLSPSGDVETSLYAEVGGSVVIDRTADAVPRVPLIVDAGVRFRVRRAKAEVRGGLGLDQRGLPPRPEANPDGTVPRTLQGILRARLPIKGTHVGWFWARAAIMLKGEGTPVVMVGVAVSVPSVAGLF